MVKMAKLKDLLKDREEWKELFEVIMEIMETGKKTKDSGMYMAGLRLMKVATKLSDVEVD